MSLASIQELMTSGGVEKSGSPPRAGGAPPSGTSNLPGSPEGGAGMLMGALDLLSRPGRAVSEALGEAQEGGSVLAGLLQGLKGDYEHGTVGEQLIPDEPGKTGEPIEEFFKGAARLAIDIGTDPLTYLLAGPIRKPIMKGIGIGFKVGDDAARAVVNKIPGATAFMQAIAQKTLPSTTYLKMVSQWARQQGRDAAKKAGAAFKPGRAHSAEIAEGTEKIYTAARIETSLAENAVQETTKRLGLHKRKAEPLLLQVDDWLRGGNFEKGVVHSDSRVQELATVIKKETDKIRDTAEAFTDLYGAKLETQHPGLKRAQKVVEDLARDKGLIGKKTRKLRDEMWNSYLRGTEEFTHQGADAAAVFRLMKRRLDKVGYKPDSRAASIWDGKGFHTHDFTRLENWGAPVMMNEVGMKAVADKGPQFHKMVRQFAKDNGMTEPQAKRILESFAGPGKAGNLEYAREFKMDPEWIERNPIKWFPRYSERSYNRMAFGKVWGLNGTKLDRLGQAAVYKEGLSSEWLADFTKIAKGHRPSDFMMGTVASKIMGFQVLTKMGPLSSLANLTQSGNTIIKDGAKNFVKGILRSMTNEGKRAGVVAHQRGIHDMPMRIAGGADAWPAKYLAAIGFTPVERMNRLLGANSSIVRVEELIRQSGKWTDELLQFGLTEKDITFELAEHVKNGGKLSQGLADVVGLRGADASQHATHFKDLPLWMQSPGSRVMFQYKSFIYQQSRFLLREVMSPARQYFKSGGKEGTIAPLLRASVIFGVGAETVNYIRQKVRQTAGKLTGLDYEPEEFNEDHPLWQLFEHSMYVGGLGIAGDLVDRAAKRDLKGWVLGPTIGDLADLAEGSLITAKKAGEEGLKDAVPWNRLMVEIQRRVPGIGTLLPREPLWESSRRP